MWHISTGHQVAQSIVIVSYLDQKVDDLDHNCSMVRSYCCRLDFDALYILLAGKPPENSLKIYKFVNQR